MTQSHTEAAPAPARAWAETVLIPTYEVGAPDKNPMFLEKRVYQGSSGAVYPHSVIDRVFDEKKNKPYTAVYLENRYIKIMLLPELGGRVQMALDKTNNYHFIYYNRVIKPALVGLAGPWISGGIEFNWPQHHRPSTFESVDWRIENNADGSVTVYCSEIERMFRTKGMHAFTIYPDKAYLQIDVQLYNRTSEPQTFLWWANPAVHVNDEYQSIFPPDVRAVMDHGKRDVSDFPIAKGTYYKVNYAPGTDISRYKNIPVPTSYMAHHSDFDFVGDYDHGKRAGMMHVANHHVVPGKKQWTWGNAGFGQAWDRQLTDEDGPYIELMCGAFTDNQPDFSWLQPGEEKRFTQIFMPYKHIGGAKNANKDAVINLDIRNGVAEFGVYVTQPREVQIMLFANEAPLFEVKTTLTPESAYTRTQALPAGTKATQVRLTVSSGAQSGAQALISFQPLPEVNEPTPPPATPARPPAEMTSNEELYLNGLHLEQYRHATYAPEPYYEEALRRDPLDSRCNNAMGLLLLRRGKFAEAEPYFRNAIKRLTSRNPNPYDGEAYYNLGLALKFQGKYNEAINAFYKAVWNDAWQSAAYFELARITARTGNDNEAIDLAQRALIKNWHHHKARHLKIALLRHTGQTKAALRECDIALEADRMEPGALWERKLLCNDGAFNEYIRRSGHTYLELALDYIHAGFFDDALAILKIAAQNNPMVRYIEGYAHAQKDDVDAAFAAYRAAAAAPSDYCFPNKIESVLIFEDAMRVNPKDARAPYYLGNFWYAHRRHTEAIACWEKASTLDPKFPTPWRNLGLAYFNKLNDAKRAMAAYERAFACNPDDARVLFELDQLRKKCNVSPTDRLAYLKQYLPLVERRDDLSIEYITLLNILGQYDEAYRRIMARNFHPWEGGEGKVSAQYVAALLGQARACLAAFKFDEAIDYAKRAQTLPLSLGEGKLPNAQENEVLYVLGLAYRFHDPAAAQDCFTRASTGLREPSSAMYYNDQPPETIYFQGLALRELGRIQESIDVFLKLVEYGKKHLNDKIKMDYFAVSLPTFLVFDEDLNVRNQIHCHYMMLLGYAGLKSLIEGQEQRKAILALDANHQGALVLPRSFY